MHVQERVAFAARDRHTALCVRSLTQRSPARLRGTGGTSRLTSAPGSSPQGPQPAWGDRRHGSARSVNRREEQRCCGEQRGGAREQLGKADTRHGRQASAAPGSCDGVASGGPGTERPDPQHRRGPRSHVHVISGAPHPCRAQPGRHGSLPRLPPPHHGRSRVAMPPLGDRQGDGAAPRRKRAPVTNGAGFTDPAAGVLGGGALVAGSLPMRGWRVTAGPMRSAAYSDAASAPLWHAAPHG
jgi:hypothetical protein